MKLTIKQLKQLIKEQVEEQIDIADGENLNELSLKSLLRELVQDAVVIASHMGSRASTSLVLNNPRVSRTIEQILAEFDV